MLAQQPASPCSAVVFANAIGPSDSLITLVHGSSNHDRPEDVAGTLGDSATPRRPRAR
jgi:hypothetical protein